MKLLLLLLSTFYLFFIPDINPHMKLRIMNAKNIGQKIAVMALWVFVIGFKAGGSILSNRMSIRYTVDRPIIKYVAIDPIITL